MEDGSKQTAEASQDLARLASELQMGLGQFKVQGTLGTCLLV